MDRESTASFQSKGVRPRAPLFLANVPEKYYQDHQLAASVQAIEAALLQACFKLYPQSFSAMYSGLEKMCKNICGLGKEQGFWKGWRAVGKKYDLLNRHPLFAEDENGRSREQQAWSKLRNEIEHQGDSPSYDMRAAQLLFSTVWDAYQLLLQVGFGFDLDRALLPETRNALELSRRTLRMCHEGSRWAVGPHYAGPLVAHMRRLVAPTFSEPRNDNNCRSELDAEYKSSQAWLRGVKHSGPDLEWEHLTCPVCREASAVFGFKPGGAGGELHVKFVIFSCPACGFTVRDDALEPHLAMVAFGETISELKTGIARQNGFHDGVISW
jgi:hypothetical protein